MSYTSTDILTKRRAFLTDWELLVPDTARWNTAWLVHHFCLLSAHPGCELPSLALGYGQIDLLGGPTPALELRGAVLHKSPAWFKLQYPLGDRRPSYLVLHLMNVNTPGTTEVALCGLYRRLPLILDRALSQ